MIEVPHPGSTQLVRHNGKLSVINVTALARSGASFHLSDVEGGGINVSIRHPGGYEEHLRFTPSSAPDRPATPTYFRQDEGLLRLVRLAFGSVATLTLPAAVRQQAVLLTPTANPGAAFMFDPRELLMFGASAELVVHRPDLTTVQVTDEYGEVHTPLALSDTERRPWYYLDDEGGQRLRALLSARKVPTRHL